MMLTTGTVALCAGLLLAPLLAHGNRAVVLGYRIAFGASIVSFIGASYTFSLQARDLRRWNVIRLSQPVLSMIVTIVLWRLRLLTLDVALIVIATTMALQLALAYVTCRRVGLAPGRAHAALIRPLSVYGMAQIAALTPALLNADLDQLILSQTVPAADLGRYAIAVTLTQVPLPVVSAIGNVAFPRLASQRVLTAATLRLQRRALLGSAALAVALLVPLAVLAPWFVPLVFGAAYRGTVPLVWMLTPGTVFLACGQVVGDLLRGRSQPSTVAWAQGFAAIFTVVLLLTLLPVVGVSGAAIASTVAYGVAFFAMLRRLVRLPRHARGSGPREAEEATGPKASDRRVSKGA
jgi:O-antigen/teichoic acid export membrane protein